MSTVSKKILIAWGVLFVFLFTGIGGDNRVCAESDKIEHRNKLGIFGGITQDRSDFDGSIGLKYEHLISESFGIGGHFDYTVGGVELSWLAAAALFFHPYDEWFIVLAPGFEFEGSERHILLRSGVGYEFEIKPRWTLAPEFMVDFVEGADTNLVYGCAVVYFF